MNPTNTGSASSFTPGRTYWDGSELLIHVLACSGKHIDYVDLPSPRKSAARVKLSLEKLRTMHLTEIDPQQAVVLRDVIYASRERLTTRQAEFLLRFPLPLHPIRNNPPSTMSSLEDATTVDRLIERGLLQVRQSKQRNVRLVTLTQLRGLPRTRRLRGEPPLMDIREKRLKTHFSC